MRTIKVLKLADNIFTVWILHFIAYNIWFGFNTEPMSEAEITNDTISTWLINAVVIIYLIIIFRVIRHYIESKMED